MDPYALRGMIDMKLKKIYLFPSVASQYGVLDNFTEELANALNRQGVISSIIQADRNNPRGFLRAILDDPPDCTLSFNGLLPDGEGRFLCDMIRIPHVACLVDSPNRFFSLVKSPLNIIACPDRHFCQIFQEMNFSHVFFLPHAVSKATNPLLEAEPLYDVLMLNSFIDYESIRAEWPAKYSPALAKVLEEAAVMTMENTDLPYMHAFVQTLDHHLRGGKVIDPQLLDYSSLLEDLESYVVGKSRVDLLKSIEDVSVHIFGSQSGKVTWKKYLRNHSNIKIHPPVSFMEALELMKRTKILLNCTPQMKYGSHERILNGLACGAAVLTLETPYMREHFRDQDDILFFQLQNKAELNHKIQTYLANDDLRNHLVGKGRETVMRHDTWDHRAKLLIKELPVFLSAIKQSSF